jgi:uncharacterized protein (TIGR00251 family)
MSSSSRHPAWLHPDGAASLLDVHVVPNARRTELDGEHGDMLRVRLGAPAVDGKANAALTDFLATCCALPRRAVHIKSGLTTRRKRVRIDAPVDAVWLRLSVFLQQPG